MYKDKEAKKNVKTMFLSMCDVKLSLTFTSLNLVLLWQLFYLFDPVFKYCYRDSRNFWTVIRATTWLYKGNNKITELRTILQRESENS
jgi:hypothetical protein